MLMQLSELYSLQSKLLARWQQQSASYVVIQGMRNDTDFFCQPANNPVFKYQSIDRSIDLLLYGSSKAGLHSWQIVIIPEKTLMAGRHERDETAAVNRYEQKVERVQCQRLRCSLWSKNQHISVVTQT